MAQALDADALQLGGVKPQENHPVHIIVPVHTETHMRGVHGINGMVYVHATRVAPLSERKEGGGFWKEKEEEYGDLH